MAEFINIQISEIGYFKRYLSGGVMRSFRIVVAVFAEILISTSFQANSADLGNGDIKDSPVDYGNTAPVSGNWNGFTMVIHGGCVRL